MRLTHSLGALGRVFRAGKTRPAQPESKAAAENYVGAQLSEVLNDEVTSSEEAGFSRRRVVKGVAWSVPVIVAAVGAPPASASPGPVTPPATTLKFLNELSSITYVGGGKGGTGPTGFQVANASGTFSGSVTITPVGTVHAKIGIQKTASGQFETTTFNGYESTTLFTHVTGQALDFPLTFTAAEDTKPKPNPNDVYSYVATVAINVSSGRVSAQTNMTIKFK